MTSGYPQRLRRWQRLVPRGELLLDETVRAAHAGDRWFASHLPDAVALPRSVRTVSKLLRLAREDGVPVTARGAGHGYVGGCVPIQGGVVISLARLNRIKEISRGDFVAVVEPGVITKNLQERCERLGLYYPPDPASRADCSIGGNLATNAGGPRCLKYGVTRDYVLGVEVVLAGGTVVRLGGRTHKNKTGFDLARLFVGSEGLLGIVTEATLKLLPLPPYRACLAVGFESMRDAARALAGVFSGGFLPSALEIADGFTLAAAERRTGSRLLAGCRAFLIVELDGHVRSVRSELRELETLLRRFRPVTLRRGLGAAGCEKFWALRREFSYALRDTGLTKLNEDVVVPRGRLEDLFRFTSGLQRRHQLLIACFGHAGDGNIHVNLMVDRSNAEMMRNSRRALDELFEQVLAWGGVITGEHGIGLAKRRWWPQAMSPAGRRLHRVVKSALDPLGILNPGKFI
ncbi:MAG: FAD-binding protein [Verrucomicrobia bacterium]|nr:FAD-binding protein [Verrucomicrobiota bacterium]